MSESGIAVVTGGAAGLGRLIGTELAGRGLHLVIADLDEAAAEAHVERLRSAGRSADFIRTDAAEATSIEQLMAQVADLGPLRVLINNAGGWLPGPQYPDSTQWRRSLDLNLVMPMLAAQLALPLMKGAGGAIVNVSSSGGVGNQPYGSPEYGAAKAGLIRFTACVAGWAEAHQVRVSCVVPHWIGLDRAKEEFERLSDEEKLASGGLVDPDLVATTVADLALDQASSGRVVVLRPHRPPYDIDPGAMDPYESPL